MCTDKIIFSGFNRRVNRLSVSLFERPYLLVSVQISKHQRMSLFLFLSHNIQACHGVVYQNNIQRPNLRLAVGFPGFPLFARGFRTSKAKTRS